MIIHLINLLEPQEASFKILLDQDFKIILICLTCLNPKNQPFH